MKTTKYFLFRRSLPDREGISNEWIQRVIQNPAKTLTQDDGGLRKWQKIEEAEGRYLRVVLLQDGETVHNDFFDRDFKE